MVLRRDGFNGTVESVGSRAEVAGFDGERRREAEVWRRGVIGRRAVETDSELVIVCWIATGVGCHGRGSRWRLVVCRVLRKKMKSWQSAKQNRFQMMWAVVGKSPSDGLDK